MSETPPSDEAKWTCMNELSSQLPCHSTLVNLHWIVAARLNIRINPGRLLPLPLGLVLPFILKGMPSSDDPDRSLSSTSGTGGTATLDDPAPLLDWPSSRSCTAVCRDSSLKNSKSSRSTAELLAMDLFDLLFFSAGRKGGRDLSSPEWTPGFASQSFPESRSNSDPELDSS